MYNHFYFFLDATPGKSAIRNFDLNPNEKSAYWITNYLWDLMEGQIGHFERDILHWN